MNNYHTHTFRCGHAVGSERAYVEQAIKEGYEAIGFSEHVPLPYFRWHLIKAIPFAFKSTRSILSLGKAFLLNGPGMRMTYSQKELYLNEIEKLQREYGNRIKIYKGFECEYLEKYLPYYRKMLENKEVDYLILGHHYHRYAISAQYYGRKHLEKSDVTNYVNEGILAMKTGLFKYFAHPDLFFAGYHHWDKFVESEVSRLLTVAKQCQVVLEVNAGGLRRKKINFDGAMEYPYPRLQFWNIVREMECEVIIGLDAHNPKQLSHDEFYKLEGFCQKMNLKMTDKSPNKNFRGI